MGMQSYISVNESHIFQFPFIDLNGLNSGQVTAGQILKLPSEGDWWVWGLMATRLDSGAQGQLPSGTNIGLNFFDPGLSQFWWTGGSLAANALLPIQHVAGKAGRPHIFSEPKKVKGGTQLVPYVAQYSGAQAQASSLLAISMLVTLADSSAGTTPIVPSLGKVINERKGEHYKALVPAQLSQNSLAAGATRQFTLPLNKNTSMIIQALNWDGPRNVVEDPQGLDPRVIEPNILVNVFDTRTTWQWASPQSVPASLMFGNYGALPFNAASFFYMEADQNLALTLTNNTQAPLTDDLSFVFDGYLNETVLAERVR